MTQEISTAPKTGLQKVQSALMISTSAFITFSVGSSALLRYIFKKDIYGLEELITIAAFWMYFTGAIYATHTKRHISAEMVGVFIKNPTALKRVVLVRHLITTGLCLLYTWWGWQFFHWSFMEKGKTTLLQIPLVVGQSAVFTGFLAMSIYLVMDLKSMLNPDIS